MRNSFSLFHLLFPTTAKFPSFHSSPFFFIISSPNFRGVSKGRRLRKEEEEVQKMYVKEDKEFARHLLFFLLISSYTNIIKRWGFNLLKVNSFSKKKKIWRMLEQILMFIGWILTEKTGQIVFTRNQDISGFFSISRCTSGVKISILYGLKACSISYNFIDELVNQNWLKISKIVGTS